MRQLNMKVNKDNQIKINSGLSLLKNKLMIAGKANESNSAVEGAQILDIIIFKNYIQRDERFGLLQAIFSENDRKQ